MSLEKNSLTCLKLLACQSAIQITVYVQLLLLYWTVASHITHVMGHKSEASIRSYSRRLAEVKQREKFVMRLQMPWNLKIKYMFQLQDQSYNFLIWTCFEAFNDENEFIELPHQGNFRKEIFQVTVNLATTLFEL